jgi:hypothetical protein
MEIRSLMDWLRVLRRPDAAQPIYPSQMTTEQMTALDDSRVAGLEEPFGDPTEAGTVS